MFVGMGALLGVACAADDFRYREDHVVSETGEATNENKLVGCCFAASCMCCCSA